MQQDEAFQPKQDPGKNEPVVLDEGTAYLPPQKVTFIYFLRGVHPLPSHDRWASHHEAAEESHSQRLLPTGGINRLIVAAFVGDISLVSELLEGGMNPHDADTNGRSTIWWAKRGWEPDKMVKRPLFFSHRMLITIRLKYLALPYHICIGILPKLVEPETGGDNSLEYLHSSTFKQETNCLSSALRGRI